MISAKEILQKYWGFSTFRKPQEEIINSVLTNNDVITLLPTGGGKSICFQVPALIKDGTCLVISPLIALMQDQIENLKKLNIKATLIPSNTKQDQIITLFDNIKFGNYKFLYISPERLQSNFIQQKIKELNINLIAIDEAHCISEWGHDFRPSYRKIKVLREIQPKANFIALTATANKKVLDDIANSLKLNNPKIYKKSFFKENLAYQIFTVENKLLRLKQIFTKTKSPAIIYVNSRKKTEEIANYLNTNNFKSTFYHAGLSSIEKQISFSNWMTEKTPIIVATNAFGMGIDKSNVGLVIHYNLPSSIENYIQETGRAGRNNKKSFAVLLQNETDILLLKEQTKKSLPTISEIKKIHQKLYQHFKIINGEILEESFNFNLLEFSKKYNFSTFKVDATLKILHNNGVIEISNNYNQKSSLQFISTHHNILNYINQHKSLKHFTNSILRTYGGLFEQETKINEFLISKKSGITSKQVITNLNQLQDANLVIYKPVKSDAEITFLVPREDDRTINRFSKEIKQFISQKKKKTSDFITYIENNKICRSIQLLAYFDEKSNKKCGICDVCLSEKKKKKKNISEEILTILKDNKKMTSQEICLFLNIDEQDILIHLRQLLSENKLQINNQNKFLLNK